MGVAISRTAAEAGEIVDPDFFAEHWRLSSSARYDQLGTLPSRLIALHLYVVRPRGHKSPSNVEDQALFGSRSI